MKHINNFFSEYEEVKKIYTEIYTAHDFWKDIARFLKQTYPPNLFFPNGTSHRYRGKGFEETVYRRNIVLKHADHFKIEQAYTKFLQKGPSFYNIHPDSEDLMRVCKSLFALFTIEERRDFIENWINRKSTKREKYIQRWEFGTFEPDPYINSYMMDSYLYMADY